MISLSIYLSKHVPGENTYNTKKTPPEENKHITMSQWMSKQIRHVLYVFCVTNARWWLITFLSKEAQYFFLNSGFMKKIFAKDEMLANFSLKATAAQFLGPPRPIRILYRNCFDAAMHTHLATLVAQA